MSLLEAEVILSQTHWDAAIHIVWALVALMSAAMLAGAINSRAKKGPPA